MDVEPKQTVTPPPDSYPISRVAIFTLDSLYSNFALKNLISVLKDRVHIVFCTERIANKKYGSFFHQTKKIIEKSGLNFFIYLNLYVFVYRFFIYVGAFYRWIRRKRTKAFSLSWLSKRYGFRVLKVPDINSIEVVRLLKRLNIDLVISIHLDQLVGKEILHLPRFGCINLHYGELPENAGPFPSIWNVLTRKQESFVTVHYMNEFFDKGDILAKTMVLLEDDDSILSLDCRLHKAGAKLIRDAITKIEKSEQIAIPQTSGQFRYRSYPSKSKLRLLKRRKVKLFHWHEFFNYFF